MRIHTLSCLYVTLREQYEIKHLNVSILPMPIELEYSHISHTSLPHDRVYRFDWTLSGEELYVSNKKIRILHVYNSGRYMPLLY